MVTTAHQMPYSKPRRCFFPGVSRQCHPITEIEQFTHVLRVEWFLWFCVEFARDVSQMVFDACLLGLEIESVQIAVTIVADQRADGSPGNIDKFRFYGLPIGYEAVVTDDIRTRYAFHLELEKRKIEKQVERLPLKGGTGAELPLVAGRNDGNEFVLNNDRDIDLRP